jgi:hypothetical protein
MFETPRVLDNSDESFLKIGPLLVRTEVSHAVCKRFAKSLNSGKKVLLTGIMV